MLGHLNREVARTALAASDFSDDLHLILFDFLANLDTTKKWLTPQDVIAALDKADLLDTCGGNEEVSDIMDGKPSQSLNAAMVSVHRTALRRRLDHVGTVIADGLTDDDTDLEQIIDTAAAALTDALDPTAQASGPTVIGALLQETLDEIEAVGEVNVNAMTGLPTGIADLDRLLNGLHPGQLIIIGGRPGVGKTTFAIDILRHVALHHQQPAALFTRELSKTQVTTRVLSAETRVPLHVLRSGGLSDDDWTRLARRMENIAEAPLFIETDINNIDEVRAKARGLIAQHGLRLIVVDCVQLFIEGRWDRYRETAGLSRVLKSLAMDLKVPIIAVSQLNRNPESRTDKRPNLWDLRDTGTLEEDADVVVFVHRDDYYDKESPRAGEADLIVAKHRNGATDTITVAAQLHLSRLVDIAL
ncbi:replicative DNA helicase [Stackebrandtia endophytica]|uniref:Replicative DNA helicase n=2 Tax=Stackebrandtia endophytica TaxID=1496996 RepID=A0A543AUU2_9ACTN|nr:replicative DNA helicase [Stackebrandtia endophytica]